MRASLFVPALSLLALTACGSSKKPVSDPSSETSGKSSLDDTPKWEGAAPPIPPEEKAKPSGGGTGARAVQEAPTRRNDQYDKEATEVVLKRAARQVKDNCGQAKDDDGKASGPWGKTNIQIVLGSNGRSKGVTVPAPYQGKPTGNCVEKAFTSLTYPPWGGQDAQIDWEIEVVNPAAPAKK